VLSAGLLSALLPLVFQPGLVIHGHLFVGWDQLLTFQRLAHSTRLRCLLATSVAAAMGLPAGRSCAADTRGAEFLASSLALSQLQLLDFARVREGLARCLPDNVYWCGPAPFPSCRVAAAAMLRRMVARWVGCPRVPRRRFFCWIDAIYACSWAYLPASLAEGLCA
jgi:hypothetical protein